MKFPVDLTNFFNSAQNENILDGILWEKYFLWLSQSWTIIVYFIMHKSCIKKECIRDIREKLLLLGKLRLDDIRYAKSATIKITESEHKNTDYYNGVNRYAFEDNWN